jgi:micrococcal nuclease
MFLSRHTHFGLLCIVAALAASPLLAQRGVSETNRHDLVERQFDATVVRVADADTLEVIVSGETRPIRIRLEGVDAPEQAEVFSREATARLRTLTLNRAVRVVGKDVDRYGRLIARVSSNGTDASRDLVRAGLACHAYAYDATLARDESDARAAGAGFWSARTKPACVTRTAFSARTNATRPPAEPLASAGSFRGNVNSHLYHAPSCRNYTCRNCTRVFATEAEAKAAGFRPAADCIKQ